MVGGQVGRRGKGYIPSLQTTTPQPSAVVRDVCCGDRSLVSANDAGGGVLRRENKSGNPFCRREEGGSRVIYQMHSWRRHPYRGPTSLAARRAYRRPTRQCERICLCCTTLYPRRFRRRNRMARWMKNVARITCGVHAARVLCKIHTRRARTQTLKIIIILF